MSTSGPIDASRTAMPGAGDGARPASPAPLRLLASIVSRLVAVIAGR
jgi:hypothetical protein